MIHETNPDPSSDAPGFPFLISALPRPLGHRCWERHQALNGGHPKSELSLIPPHQELLQDRHASFFNVHLLVSDPLASTSLV